MKRIVVITAKQAEAIKMVKQDYENHLIKEGNIKFPLMSGGYANGKSFLSNIFKNLKTK